MAAPEGTINALAVDSEPAEALTLLDALARAPAAAPLFAAIDQLEDRKALRLVHAQLRDAVGEATTKLKVDLRVAAAARPPTARRWPRLEELTVRSPDSAALAALGADTWRVLHSLRLADPRQALDAPLAGALAAALRRMPALRALEMRSVLLPDEAAQELFRASHAEAAPQLRALHIWSADLSPAAAGLLAATGWPLEELDLGGNADLGAAGAAALAAAPSFAIRRLGLWSRLDAASLLILANAPWPLEELDLWGNDFSTAAAGPALAALSRHTGLRRLGVRRLSAASFKALVEAAWPALTSLSTYAAKVAFDGPHALGAAAFTGFPALEELDLSEVALGEVGAALLASRRWTRLRKLELRRTQLGDAGLAALARGEWPALEVLDLCLNSLGAPRLTLTDARRWAPALVELDQ